MHRIKKILATQTIKDSFVVFIGLGVTAFLGFIYTIVMARVLKPDFFGVFSAVTSLVAIVYSFGDLGVGPAIIHFLPKHPENEKKLINSSFWFQFLIGSIIVILFFTLSGYSNIFVPKSLPEHFILVGVLSFNYLLIGWSQAIFTAKKKFLSFSFSQIIDSVIKIIIVFWLLRVSNLSISTAIIANFVSTIFAFLFTFGKSLLKIKPEFDAHTFNSIFHYSKWIAVSRLFSVFFSRVDIILLNLLASSFAAGIFAAASRITLLFAMIVSSLGSVVNPRFSEFKSKAETVDYIKKLFLLITGVSAIVLFTVAFARPIIITVFGVSFAESVKVFQLLAISMIPFLYSVIFTAAILYTFRQPQFYAFTTFLQFAIVLVVNILYIPKLGAYAPVLGSAISNLLVFTLSAIKLKSLLTKENIN